MEGEKKKDDRLNPNPRATCNPMSSLTFSWLNSIFWTGHKRDLEMSDLYEALPEHSSDKLGDKFEKYWTEEMKKKSPSLFKVILRSYGLQCAMYGLLLLFIEVGIRLMQPMFLGRLVKYFNQEFSLSPNKKNTDFLQNDNLTSFIESDQGFNEKITLLQPLFLGYLVTYFGNGNVTKEEAYWYAFGVIMCSVLYVAISHPYMMGILHLGMKFRVACCSLIYRKSLRLSKTALGDTTIGQVVNLLSNDVNRFDVAIIFLHYMWVGPVGTVVTTYIMWQKIGVSALIGVTFMLLFIPLQAWLGKRTSVLRLRTALRTDERVRLMNEIINGIQVIKMYTWEDPFTQLVQMARKREIKEIRATSYIRGTLISFIIFVTRVSLFCSILSFVLSGYSINAEDVFIVTSYYNILRQTMTVFFPQGIAQIAEARISVRRLQKFMLYEEINQTESDKSAETFKFNKKDNFVDAIHMESDEDMNPINNGLKKTTERSVILSNVHAKWIGEQSENTLTDVSIHVKPGSLVAVVGPVGSGKSSLLNVVLKELPLDSGSISVNGSISYAAQEPWLFVGTIRQNILFGTPMHRVRYNSVIKFCSLERDLKLFPRGDKTIVGERGVSLSGGQRARINLARAVYRNSDIYLLDDPLSAVDTHVGRELFDNCISGFLKNKTRILITHQLQYLNDVDHIVILKNGSIAAEGNFASLQASGLDFAELLKSDEKEMESEEDEEKEEETREMQRHLSIHSTTSAEDAALPNEGPEEEQRSKGSVGSQIYGAYCKAAGSYTLIFSMFGSAILAQILASGSDYWTTYWVNSEEAFLNTSNDTSLNDVLVQTDSFSLTRSDFIYIYSAIIVLLVVVTLSRSFLFFGMAMRASINLHNNMFSSITRATMRFFHTNQSGRILNRFSKDMGSIDEMLPSAAIDVLQIGLSLIGIIIVVILVNWWLIFPTFFVGLIFYYLRAYYLQTSRSVKRLEGITRSPVFSHLSASLQGMTTIRAFSAQSILAKEFDMHQDLHSSAWYLFIATSRAFGYWLDIVCVLYIALVTLSFLVLDLNSSGGNVGLAITQAMGLTGMFQWGMRQSAEMENQMTSVERVIEYSNLESEPALKSSEDKKPRPTWPENGELSFKEVWLRYMPDGEAAIRGLSFKLLPSEKLGIVGRTGAGKSSIISALFRLAFVEGKIEIDGVNSTEIGLHDLRSKLSIIPQEPVLFSGTMRKNLDPFNEYNDEILWKALEEVELKEAVTELAGGLDSKMSEGGSNFSVGQRQLVCLARAIVRKNKILVMDEATANVDPQTDALIQKTIRNKFSECTVLTIAHRLHTVMDSDKVLVMDAGKMVEFDHPHVLLQNENGVFKSMINQTGKGTSELLLKTAQASYENRKNK